MPVSSMPNTACCGWQGIKKKNQHCRGGCLGVTNQLSVYLPCRGVWKPSCVSPPCQMGPESWCFPAVWWAKETKPGTGRKGYVVISSQRKRATDLLWCLQEVGLSTVPCQFQTAENLMWTKLPLSATVNYTSPKWSKIYTKQSIIHFKKTPPSGRKTTAKNTI